MACNDNKLKSNCGPKRFATCVYYESDIPEWSDLSEEQCVVIEETTEDLYNKVTELIDELNVEGFSTDCDKIEIEEVDGKITIQSLLKTYLTLFELLLCDGESTDDSGTDGPSNDIDISDWGINLDCYKDVCSEPIKTLSELIKQIAEKHCTKCVDVNKIAAHTTYTSPLPDVIVIEPIANAIFVTLPSLFCQIVKVKVKGLSRGSRLTNTVDGTIEYVFSDNEYAEFIFDGNEIIKL